MKKFLPIVVCVLFLGCSRIFDDSIGDGNGSIPEKGLYGKVVLEDGSPAQGAQVEVWKVRDGQADTLLEFVDETTVDKSGRYLFADLEPGEYYVVSRSGDLQDVYTVFITELTLDSLLDAGIDTLLPAGSIKTKVYLDSALQDSVDCYIPGTPFHAVSDNDGVCVIDSLPSGSYDVYYRHTVYVYQASDVKVSSGEETTVGSVTLEPDTALRPSAPTDLSAEYDAESGVVHLSWKAVEGPYVAGYMLYRDDMGSASQTRIDPGELVSGTAYADSFYADFQDTASRTVQYRIRTQTTYGDSSKAGEFEVISVTVPNKPAMPLPANGAVDVSLSPYLTWIPVKTEPDQVVRYNVYLDRESDPATIVARGLSNTFVKITNLEDGATYYWQVVALTGGNEIEGPVWSFTTLTSPGDNTPPAMPSRPDPQHQATGVSVSNFVLRWSGGDPDAGDTVFNDVYLSADNPPTVKIGNGVPADSFPYYSLANSTTYYWRIVASDGKAVTTGPVWSFTTRNPDADNIPPDKPVAVFPENGEIGVDTALTLAWSGRDPDQDDSVSYSLLLGENIEALQPLASGERDSVFDVSGLLYNTIYYWKVVASDGRANTPGDVWRFITKAGNAPPNTPVSPKPVNGGSNQDVNLTLSWKGGDPDENDILTYDVYLDTVHPPSVKITSGYPDTALPLEGLQGGTLYYWQVVASDGRLTAQSAVWNFSTKTIIANQPPYKPELLAPPDESAGLDTVLTMKWRGGDSDTGDVVLYSVMIGTDVSSMTKVAGGLTDTAYEIAALNFNTTYFWRVIASDGKASTESDLQSFSTKPPPSLTLIAPNGGEDWQIGTVQEIKWNSAGEIDSVRLEYTTTGGIWYLISASTPNDGSFSWTVPLIITEGVAVRVTALGRPVMDASDSLFTISVATPDYDFSWVQRAGGYNVDVGYGITVDQNGNSYVTGSFSGDNVDFGNGRTASSLGGTDIFIAKYNLSGVCQWVRGIGGALDEGGRGIALDQYGNIFVTGFFITSEVPFGNSRFVYKANDSSDFFIAMFNEYGTCLWAESGESYSGTGHGEAYAVAVDGSGNSYITGYFRGRVTFTSNRSLFTEGNEDVFVAKYNTEGSNVWAVRAGGSGKDNGNSVAVDGAGNCYVTGTFSGDNAGFGDGKAVSSTGGGDFFTVKYSTEGTCLWVRSAGGPNNDMGHGIAVDAAGNSYVTGAFSGLNVQFDPGREVSALGLQDVFTAKYNTAGACEWVQAAGSENNDVGFGIVLDGTGASYLTGSILVPSGSGGGDVFVSNLFIMKYDVNGVAQWAQHAGGSGNDIGLSIAYSGGDCFLTGLFAATAGFGSKSVTASGPHDVFVTRYGPLQ
jgi:hypothetical protein